MNLNDLFNEEKVRLDPKCWTGKKIGNPKTKMKGGTRVNNCVPAESVNEMDKSQTPPGRDGNNDSDAGKKEYTAKATTPKKVAQDGEKILNKELNKKQGVAEATGDQKFDSMMGQITGGATARQSVDSLNKSLTARTGSDPETALAKWGQEFINWLEKICRNFERQGVDRFNKLEKVGNLDDGGETMAHWLIEVAKQSNTSGITQADIQEFSSEFNTHGMWAWHQFPIAWGLKEWQDYKDQWTGPDGYIANLGQGMTEEYELAGVGVAYELGRRAYKQGMTIRDNPYSATKEARKNDEWAKGLERGKHDANDARHFRSSVREQAVAEGTLDPGVNHRGDVDRNADIEVLGVDYNTKTWKITYNGKPYTVKADYFSREDLSRWQIPDYDVEIINRNGKNIMNMIDWDNEGSSKTDRQIKMVNTIIAYLDTENAQDIQYMAWKDQELENVTAHEFYNDIRNFYNKDQQKIDQTVQWLLKNMTDDEAREGLADYIKNPVNPLDWNTKENLKNNRTYLMYVAFSYSREGNTEMTPGMNLPKIQLNDPDDEDELQQQLDALFKKVKFKFDAFENKIVELGDKFGFNPPDLGSGMGAREMFWELTMQTAWPKEYKYTQKAATDILNFKAAVDKYAKSFNSSLIKIGLPGISEYAIWYGVLSDDLTQQQVDYFATPEGFANVANGKINVSKMINDNMQRKSLEEKLGDNRPKLGSKRDAGKSIRKWRKTRGLDETGVAEGLGGGVDAKGRTQQQWIRLVKAKYPDARIMQSKMIDGPCQAILSDGRKLSWIKVNNQSTEIDEASWNPTTGGDYPVDVTGREMVTGPSDQKWQAAIDYYNDNIFVRRALQDLANKNSRLAPQQYVATFANRANRDETRYFKSKSEAYEYARISGHKLTSIEKLDNDEVTPPVTYNVILGVKEHRRMFKLTFASDEVAQKWEHDNKDVVKIQWNDERGQYSPPTTPRAPDTYGGKIPGDETDQVNEKSVSQAQFRTMAAAAHNPEFAKKVGIGQAVAKEFHGADRKQDYTDLPKKADESKSAPKEKEADYGDDYQDMVARVKKLAGLGPLKTVYDPQKRVYRNMPTAVQPKK